LLGRQRQRSQQTQTEQLREYAAKDGALMSVNEKKIRARFSRHVPTDDQKQRIERITQMAEELSIEIERSCPDGDDKKAILRHLIEAKMTASLCILCEDNA
jgi:hypothetical protein